MSMELVEKAVTVDALEVGMYISRLDRPWSETPFPLQGLAIESQDDIDTLSRLCRTVYVDQRRSRTAPASSPKARKPAVARMVDPKTSPLFIEPSKWKRRHCVEHYSVSSKMTDELKQVTPLVALVEHQVTSLHQRIAGHQSLHIEPLVECTSDLMESVIRNPDALAWVCQIMQTRKPVLMHMIRSAVWAGIVGRQLGLNRFSLLHVSLAQMLTGIGKSTLSDATLKTHNVLQHSEAYREHLSEITYQLEQEHFSCKDVINTLAHYCERHDGSGYPNRLVSDKIPFHARIVGLVDTFEYLVHPFNQHAISPAQAISRLNKLKGQLFDAPLVEAFVQAIGIYPTGSVVQISNGTVAMVVENSYEKRIQASVIPLIRRSGRPYTEFRVVDLDVAPRGDGSSSTLMIKRGLPAQAVPQALVQDAHRFLFEPKRGGFLAKFLKH